MSSRVSIEKGVEDLIKPPRTGFNRREEKQQPQVGSLMQTHLPNRDHWSGKPLSPGRQAQGCSDQGANLRAGKTSSCPCREVGRSKRDRSVAWNRKWFQGLTSEIGNQGAERLGFAPVTDMPWYPGSWSSHNSVSHAGGRSSPTDCCLPVREPYPSLCQAKKMHPGLSR